jgi:hypothetical protein
MSWTQRLTEKRLSPGLMVVFALYAAYWLVLVMDYVWWRLLPGLQDWLLLFNSLNAPEFDARTITGLGLGAVHVLIVAVVPLVCLTWIRWARSERQIPTNIVYSISFVAMWHWGTYVCDQWVSWYGGLNALWWIGQVGTFLIGLAWAVWAVERGSQHYWVKALFAPPQALRDPKQLRWPKAIGGLTVLWGLIMLIATAFHLISAWKIHHGPQELGITNAYYVAMGWRYFVFGAVLLVLGLCLLLAGLMIMFRSALAQAASLGAASVVLILLTAIGGGVTFLLWQIPESKDPMGLVNAYIIGHVVQLLFWGSFPVFLVIWFSRRKVTACVSTWRFVSTEISQSASSESVVGQSGSGRTLSAAGDFAYMPEAWNPLNLNAWYYGQRQRKVNQSLATFFVYSLAFMLVLWFVTQVAGCMETYEMPAGGGKPKRKVQVVKVVKIKKLKFIINPLSVVIFNPPPIDDRKLNNLKKLTKHMYQVGYGKGKGAGFSAGTKQGKVRFIRLEYSGGDWDQGMGHDSDLLMLLKYFEYTGHKIHNRTESRTVAQLKNFPIGKSPPMVYLTGQKNIYMSKTEQKILREYLLEKHGMIFCSNGGSSRFGGQFRSLMGRILPKVQPVKVPLDDVIHRIPFDIPFLPYVAPHDGTDAIGWKVDGRWVAYYHPGDIGDAWSADHAGVKPEIWEYCYQLGTNVIFYAHAEYNKWLEARKKE